MRHQQSTQYPHRIVSFARGTRYCFSCKIHVQIIAAVDPWTHRHRRLLVRLGVRLGRWWINLNKGIVCRWRRVHVVVHTGLGCEVGNLPKRSMTSDRAVNEPQRNVECFCDLVLGRVSLGVKVDHFGPEVLREKDIAGVCLEGSDKNHSG